MNLDMKWSKTITVQYTQSPNDLSTSERKISFVQNRLLIISFHLVPFHEIKKLNCWKKVITVSWLDLCFFFIPWDHLGTFVRWFLSLLEKWQFLKIEIFNIINFLISSYFNRLIKTWFDCRQFEWNRVNFQGLWEFLGIKRSSNLSALWKSPGKIF